MIRLMSNTEKGMAGIAMDKGNWRIASIIKLINEKDQLTVKLLRNVLNKLQQRHPVLQLAIRLKGEQKQNIFWEQSADVEIPITEYHNGENALEIWKEYASRPLKDGEGVCSVVYISAAKETSLIIFLEHLAGDAASYTSLCNEILTGISEYGKFEQHQNQLAFTPSIEECVTRSLGGKLKSRMACFSNCLHFFSQISKKHKTFPVHPDLKNIKVNKLTEHVEQFVLTTEYTEHQTRQILQFCRNNNTTITGFAGSLVSDAFVKVYKNHTSELGLVSVLNHCAVSTRKLYTEPLPDEYLGCHYSFTAPIRITTSGNSDVNEVISNANNFQHKTSRSIASKYPLGFSLFTGFVRSRASDNYPAWRDANLFLTNWASLKLNQHYGEWEVREVIPLITLTRLASISLIISTFANRLQLTLSAPAPFFSKQHISDLHDYANNTMKKILKSEYELPA